MSLGMYGIISRKRDDGELTRDEIEFFINGYVQGIIPDYQASALLMAIFLRGLSPRELTDLTDAMLHSGRTVPLSGIKSKKIDKHSTGGVGDKVTFVVAPLIASLGISVPMLAGRGLGHTGGTLDKLETIPGMQILLTPERFRQVLEEAGMAIGGQTEDIVPADRKLYALRNATATVSSIPLIASSIMSKKLALETDGIVLDVKTGSGAFMPQYADALSLCQTMVEIGERAGRRTIGVITDMASPLGFAVGNALEIAESIECLKGKGPEDLEMVAFALAREMLRAAGQELAPAEEEKVFREAIVSGKALAIFRAFIRLQGGDERICDDLSRLPRAPEQMELRAGKSGFISRIDAFAVGMAAVEAGAGRRRKEDTIDPAAGFVFSRRTGDDVCGGELLATVHAAHATAAKRSLDLLQSAISISTTPPAKRPLVHARVDRSGAYSLALFPEPRTTNR